jgi:hypothetical protein
MNKDALHLKVINLIANLIYILEFIIFGRRKSKVRLVGHNFYVNENKTLFLLFGDDIIQSVDNKYYK